MYDSFHHTHNSDVTDCLLNRLSGDRSKKTSKFRVTGLCEGNSPETRKMCPFDDAIMLCVRVVTTQITEIII